MKAAVYYGPEDIRATEVDDPELTKEHEILVEVAATSICGSDLHLYRGALDPIMEKGKSRTGHELIGKVLEIGSKIVTVKPGDRVSMAYSCSCGDCHMCQIGQTAHCETTQKAIYGFGLPFGDLNGTHAEAMVLPYADSHVIKVPDTITDAAALTLSCNLPSAIIANHLADLQPGENLAIIGCGPTGLMSLDVALQHSSGKVVAIDKVPYRLRTADTKGAETIDTNTDDWKDQALAHTSGRGFDKVIEVVGSSQSLQMSLDIIRPGGTVAAIGVFCEQEFNLVLADVFLRNITLHMNGFANVQPFMREALSMLEQGILDPDQYFSHHFSLDNIDQAFATFDAKSDGAMKMLIRP